MPTKGCAVGCEIDRGETYEMSVDRNGFVHRFSDRWVQQHALGAVRQRIAPTCLGAQIGVDLVEVSAAQRRLAPPACRDDPRELGVDHDPPARRQIVEHDIGLHARQNASRALAPPIERPVEGAASPHAPALGRQDSSVEAADRALEQPPRPLLLPIGHWQMPWTRPLGRQNEVHRQDRTRQHLLIRGVMAADPVGAELGARRHRPSDTERLHVRRQPSAAMAKLGARDQPGHRLKRAADEAVAGRVDAELHEAARHGAARKQLSALGTQDVDPASDPLLSGLARDQLQRHLPWVLGGRIWW